MLPLKPEQRTLLANPSETNRTNHDSIYEKAHNSIFSLDMEEEEEDDEDDEDSEKLQLIQLECNNNINYFKEKLLNNLPKKYNRRLFHVQHGIKTMLRLSIAVVISMVILVTLYLPIYSNISARHSPLSDWGFNTSRNLADYILPENDTTLLEPKHICDSKVFLMIIVCSSVQNFAARQIIRETWGNSTEFNYSMFPILHEHLKGQYLLPSKSRLRFYENHFLKPSMYYGNYNVKNDHTSQQATNSSSIPITSSSFVTALPSSLLLSLSKTSSPLSFPKKNIFNEIIPNIKILFLIGRNKDESLMGNETNSRIHNEAMQYNDIIQENFIDSYNNLTIKTIFTLKWFKKTCLKQVAFLMKCDDDTFVNIPNLIHYLLGGTVPLYNDTYNYFDMYTSQTLATKNRLKATENYLAGHLFCTSKPISDVNSKWYMPFYMYPEETYPMYLSGAGYVMTSDVVQKLYETALNTTFIHLEDVYLTGIVAAKAGIKPLHHPLFDYTRSRNWCSFKGILTQHELKDDSLFDAYYFVANTTYHCPSPELQLRWWRDFTDKLWAILGPIGQCK